MTGHFHEDDYFEALGEPKLFEPFGTMDHYRFWRVHRQLIPGSVLDVGAYFGDFLKLAQKDGREIRGTEINAVRRDLANSILGSDVVVVDFRNGRLTQFRDSSVDNVVAMEVVEHVHDIRHAISELCRVARKRVILTVPFRERIQYVLCIHCNTYTPYSGHLHSFDFGSFSTLVPSNWNITREVTFANRAARWISVRLPTTSGTLMTMNLLDRLKPDSGQWLLTVVEPESSAPNE
jgi:ubiquinone/menaquinone biosynthesis C-methylase UbiE